MARRQELFEYFKSKNAYTVAQSSSAGGGQRRRRRTVRRRNQRTKKRSRSGRALDALRPTVAEFLTGAPWLTASAVLLIAVAMVLGSFLLGRSRGPEDVTELSSRAPGAKFEEQEKTEVEEADVPAYSILVMALEDSPSNTERALDIEGNLVGLGYPAEAVLVPAKNQIRIYVGENTDTKNAELRSWLKSLNDLFPKAEIVER